MAAETIKIASWNICDGLTNAQAMPDVVERIKGFDADIVSLPEAFNEAADTGDAGKAALLEEALSSLEAEGYHIFSTLYDDRDGRQDRHGFTMIDRLDEGDMHVVDLSSRKVVGKHVGDLSLTVVGVHLDDRSEIGRLEQASNLVGGLVGSDHNVVMGDFNAMHRDDRRAQILRPLRPLARLLPSVDPGQTAENLAWLRTKASKIQRLTDMATGSVMAYFEDAGYKDADPERQPTLGPVQLDHVMTNFGSLHHGHYLSIGKYQVHDVPAEESDHSAISAVISY